MSVLPADFKSLFPGRNIQKEWKSRPGRNELPPLSEISCRIPIDRSQLIELYESGQYLFRSDYEDLFISTLPGITRNYTDNYYRGILTFPTKKAVQLQERADLYRGVPWWEHKKTLSKKRLLTSLRCLNEDYNPLIDERNHTQLAPGLDGTYISDLIRGGFKGRITRVRFGLLRPGEGVKPHIDVVPNYACRIHIPIYSNSMSYMFFKKEGKLLHYQMEVGRCYLLNGGVLHWSHNFGGSDRLHLVMSVDGTEDFQL